VKYGQAGVKIIRLWRCGMTSMQIFGQGHHTIMLLVWIIA
jgi:hypothetical protein